MYLIEVCNEKPEKEEKDEYYPLHIAAQYGNISIIKYLIENCNVSENNRSNGWTAMHFSTRNGQKVARLSLSSTPNKCKMLCCTYSFLILCVN